MKTPLIVLLYLVSFFTLSVEDNNRNGYWWGEKPQTEEEKAKEEQEKDRTLPPLPPVSDMMKMHPEEIREMEKKYLDQALWKLTPEATEQYYTVLKVVRLKAKAFAATHGLVKMTNPELSLTQENPQMAAGRATRKKETEVSIINEFNNYNEQYGLLMFSSKGCGACKSQKIILEEMNKRYGIEFTIIDSHDNADIAMNFDIRNTPTTILVKRNSDKWIPISFGLQSLPVLKDHSYRGMLILEDKIKPTQFYTPPNMIGSGLDPLSVNTKRGG